MEWVIPSRYLEPFNKEIDRGEPVKVPIFNHDTLERQFVKAVIYKAVSSEPGADKLWLKNAADWIEPKSIGIKILEFLPEDMSGYVESPYDARRTRG